MKHAAPLMFLTLMAAMPAVSADSSTGYLDLFVVPEAQLDSDSTIKGDGYGFKGAFNLGNGLFASGEYQDVDYDDLVADVEEDGDAEDDRISTSLKQFRVGLGLRQPIGSSTLAFGQVEYIDADLDAQIALSNGTRISGRTAFDDDGYGVHVGLRGENGPLGVTAKIGYLDVSDIDGPEYEVEADYRIWEFVGLFANYRWSDLGSDDTDLELKDFRVGVTIYLGS